ncbi:hypothetical protein DY023_02715 [Microbacterium bovistercoris]|uniref:Uncharacterized protein n=1 Tax=Microbacterium bovistercoris TaxID=2293570 RepID=A0A371NXG9_9MICO|nr:hypothetical protein [Microbacterium bovistercoris]REJ07906.1 hypothetical protein DY023_02715 [Microbacterium bovistercoris]
MLATVLFLGFAILGLGMLSYFADVDILDVPALGQYPGVVGMLAAIVVFVVVLAPTARMPHPAYPASVLVALASALAHLAGVWLAALIGGAGVTAATAAVMQLVTGGATLVIGLAAVVAAWIGIALRRTRAQKPQWPWEDRSGDE